jgi:hypothetical protein
MDVERTVTQDHIEPPPDAPLSPLSPRKKLVEFRDVYASKKVEKARQARSRSAAGRLAPPSELPEAIPAAPVETPKPKKERRSIRKTQYPVYPGLEKIPKADSQPIVEMSESDDAVAGAEVNIQPVEPVMESVEPISSAPERVIEGGEAKPFVDSTPFFLNEKGQLARYEVDADGRDEVILQSPAGLVADLERSLASRTDLTPEQREIEEQKIDAALKEKKKEYREQMMVAKSEMLLGSKDYARILRPRLFGDPALLGDKALNDKVEEMVAQREEERREREMRDGVYLMDGNQYRKYLEGLVGASTLKNYKDLTSAHIVDWYQRKKDFIKEAVAERKSKPRTRKAKAPVYTSEGPDVSNTPLEGAPVPLVQEEEQEVKKSAEYVKVGRQIFEMTKNDDGTVKRTLVEAPQESSPIVSPEELKELSAQQQEVMDVYNMDFPDTGVLLTAPKYQEFLTAVYANDLENPDTQELMKLEMENWELDRAARENLHGVFDMGANDYRTYLIEHYLEGVDQTTEEGKQKAKTLIEGAKQEIAANIVDWNTRKKVELARRQEEAIRQEAEKKREQFRKQRAEQKQKNEDEKKIASVKKEMKVYMKAPETGEPEAKIESSPVMSLEEFNQAKEYMAAHRPKVPGKTYESAKNLEYDNYRATMQLIRDRERRMRSLGNQVSMMQGTGLKRLLRQLPFFAPQELRDANDEIQSLESDVTMLKSEVYPIEEARNFAQNPSTERQVASAVSRSKVGRNTRRAS